MERHGISGYVLPSVLKHNKLDLEQRLKEIPTESSICLSMSYYRVPAEGKFDVPENATADTRHTTPLSSTINSHREDSTVAE
jgi:hypothetical protein